MVRLSQEKRAPAIAAIAGALLNKPAEAGAAAPPLATWQFEFPKSIEDG